METDNNIIEPLFERVAQYSKTTIDLLKMEALKKLATVTGSLVNRLVTAIIAFVFILFLSIAGALWLGHLLGQTYYGFLIVAGFYGLIWVILLLIPSTLKKWVSNSVITQILHD